MIYLDFISFLNIEFVVTENKLAIDFPCCNGKKKEKKNSVNIHLGMMTCKLLSFSISSQQISHVKDYDNYHIVSEGSPIVFKSSVYIKCNARSYD